LKLGAAGRFAEHLAGLQKADQPIAEPHRDGGLAQAGGAGERMRLLGRGGGQLFLHRQARRAGAAGLQHHGAKGAFVALPMMGELPGLHRPQRHRQPGRLGEGARIILKHHGIVQRLDQAAVVVHLAASARKSRGLPGRSFPGGLRTGLAGRTQSRSPAVFRAWLAKCCSHGNKLRQPKGRVNPRGP